MLSELCTGFLEMHRPIGKLFIRLISYKYGLFVAKIIRSQLFTVWFVKRMIFYFSNVVITFYVLSA